MNDDHKPQDRRGTKTSDHFTDIGNATMVDPTPAQGFAPMSDSAAPAPLKVLIVDDNIDSAVSMGMLLRLVGNDTQTAHDGEAAFAAAQSYRPDIMLLDIGLPKLDGYQVARMIRAEAWGSAVYLVAVTGWGQDEDRRNTAQAGFDLHMVKPVELETLENLLQDFRKRAGS